MNTETQEKIENYRKELEAKLAETKAERKTLITKLSNGESLSRKENKRNQELAKLEDELNEKLKLFKEVDIYEYIIEAFRKISDNKIKAKKKEIEELIKIYRKMNQSRTNTLKQLTGFSQKELKNLSSTKANLEKRLLDLDLELKNAEKRGYDTKEIEKDIEDTKITIQYIIDYLNSIVDVTELENDLKILSNQKTTTKDKQGIKDKYLPAINANKAAALEDIVIEMEKGCKTKSEDEEENKDKKTIKERTQDIKEKTKEKLEATKEYLKAHKKAAGAIVSAVILAILIAVLVRLLTSKTEYKNYNPTEISQLELEEAKNLIKKGYSEDAAYAMAKTLPENIINTLLTSPYISAIEEYSSVEELNIDYIVDYENARTIYNLTADKAVDYVNRAYSIQATNFYEDATINEIVEVVMAIDNKELFTTDNANLAQSFNTSFNRVVDNYLFGTTTEEDIEKIDALPYFAKDGSDMDNFLGEFSEITKEILSDPNDEVAKNKMYKLLNIFATSLNGFTNEEDTLTTDGDFNKNAQINDYYDWYMIYNSFIAPLYPTFVEENEFTKYEELQGLMISALQGPEFERLCGQSRTLGGE